MFLGRGGTNRERGGRARRRVEHALIAGGLAGLSVGTLFAVAPPADAAFTGTNGPIAFVSTRLNDGSFGGIFQVNSQSTGLGNSTGDQSATTGLTDAGGGSGVDAEPFYSPNGSTVFFSSSRDARGDWAIYDIATASPEPPGSATELSQVSGSESDNDFGPSVANDGETVIFNRNDLTIDSLDAKAADPASTVCVVYTPPASADGLAAGNTSDGGTSRVLFNPTNPTQILYVGGDNHLHLVTGLPPLATTSPTNANECAHPAQNDVDGVVDRDLSAAASDSISGSPDADPVDENPDWSPNGSSIIFDSTRNGTNSNGTSHALWQLTNISSGTLTATPLWSSQIANGGPSTTEPVYSPDGTQIAFVEQSQGANTFTGEVVGAGSGLSSAVDVSLSTEGKGIVNDQPDWGPGQPNDGATPEAPVELMLPGAGLLIGGLALVVERRRRGSRRTLPA